MASCYHCGAYIAPNQGFRRKVATGDSIGLSFGRRITPSVRAYYSRRTLCLYCATQYDHAEKRRSTAIIFILVALASVWLFSVWSGTQSTSSSFGSEANTQSGSNTNRTPSIAAPITSETISVKIVNMNCYPIDFFINSDLVASVPSGMARIATSRAGPFEAKLCHVGSTNCGTAGVINWHEGMTYTIAAHESCTNRNTVH